MRYFTKTCLYLFFFFSWVSLGPPVYAQPYEAQVIDAETKQPIEGAAVLAYWKLVIPRFPHPMESVHDALETVTDTSGNFTMPAMIGGPVDPQAEISVLFTIFKPGYEAYKKGSLKPTSTPKELKEYLGLTEEQVYERNGRIVVELRPLRTRQEKLENFIGLLPSPCRQSVASQNCVSPDKYRNLNNLVNEERQNLGLEPVRVPRGGLQ